MARNNIKLLTDIQLKILNEKYIFELDGDEILVKFHHYGRVTRHDANKPFHINAKKIRKVCFNVQAIEIWKSMQSDKKVPTLLSVQQAVNKLTITFQPVNVDTVRKLLFESDIKLKNI